MNDKAKLAAVEADTAIATNGRRADLALSYRRMEAVLPRSIDHAARRDVLLYGHLCTSAAGETLAAHTQTGASPGVAFGLGHGPLEHGTVSGCLGVCSSLTRRLD